MADSVYITQLQELRHGLRSVRIELEKWSALTGGMTSPDSYVGLSDSVWSTFTQSQMNSLASIRETISNIANQVALLTEGTVAPLAEETT